jgi:glycyl-tRNA synthetase beta chain
VAANFLLEIGTEEIPARFLPPALEELAAKAENLLAEYRLGHGLLSVYGTPRRLTLYVRELAAAQTSLVREVKGPPRKAAFDLDGNPTRAATGFARSQGVAVADLVTRPVGKVEYVFAVKEEAGRPAAEILAELCPRLIAALSFPKSMRWSDQEFRFIRPIRWVLSLYGADVVEFEVAGVRSGRHTWGHRFLSAGRLAVPDADSYFALLEDNFVILDPARRRELVWEQVRAAAAAEGGTVDEDPGLLAEVADLLEYPTAFCGRFPESYLALPEPVLVTPMREHQRYFPVRGADGRLLPLFIGVHNGTSEHLDLVRSGNEKVFRARLADAEFFFCEDLETPLAKKGAELRKVIFQEDLGTMHDKVQRLAVLVDYLAGKLGLDDVGRRRALRAAALCKNDLVTGMVYEFPELQGVMGREYALRDGEDPVVAEAIREQYLPPPGGDELPRTGPGLALALADRADNLVGAFGRGIQPTGSQDPYALRRQALGICHLVLDTPAYLDLDGLFREAHAAYGGCLAVGAGETVTALAEFFGQRLRGLFQDRGLAYDVVEAVLASGHADVRDAWERAVAVTEFREHPAFEDICTAFTRAHNLARNATGMRVDPGLFVDPAEDALYRAYLDVRDRVDGEIAARRYGQALAILAELREPVDHFFDAVLVMADDAAVRANRLALLRLTAGLFRRIADLSKIVKGQGTV